MSPRGATDVIDPELATVEHTRRRCARHTPNPIMQSNERNCADTIGTVPILCAVHLYNLHSHKLELQKQEIKKTKEKERHTTCQRAQRAKCILTKHGGREALKTQVLENASTKQRISQGWKTHVRKTQVRKMQVQCKPSVR